MMDFGTTNTRVWLVDDSFEVLGRANTQVGARDVARSGSSQALYHPLQSLIGTVVDRHEPPECVIAAGMIGSPQGLFEVKPIVAPAGVAELAAACRRRQFPEIAQFPFVLVPGIRSGHFEYDLKRIGYSDIMRGEETLCVGLLAQDIIGGPATVLNLGSHWKTIHIDAWGRIAASRTSLLGEVIHAVQEQTVLASALPRTRVESIDLQHLQAGMDWQVRCGIGRALFCVRLLEQAGHSDPAQRLSFLIGAFISSEIDSLLAEQWFTPGNPIAVTGSEALVKAWSYALDQHSIPVLEVSNDQVEQAMRAGLLEVIKRIDFRAVPENPEVGVGH